MGVQQLVQRRISRIPPEALPLLQTAAILGREIDLALLHTAFPDLEIQWWLHQCLETVLAVKEGNWLFIHDKLRDAILATIPDHQKPGLHHQVARAIESVYHDEPEHWAALAFHLSESITDPAHDGALRVKAIHYLEKAGLQALNGYANHKAVQFLSKALALDIHHEHQARYRHWEQALGQAMLGLGRLEASETHFSRALVLYGYPLPTTNRALMVGLFSQLGLQVFHRFQTPLVKSAAAKNTVLAASRIYDQITEIHVLSSKPLNAIYDIVRGTNLAENGGATPERALMYSLMSLACGLARWGWLANYYIRRAEVQVRADSESVASGRILMASATYLTIQGNWEESAARFEQANALWKRLQNWRDWSTSRGGLIGIALFQGNFALALSMSGELAERARRSGHTQAQVWGLDGQAEALVRLGRAREAVAKLEQSAPLLATDGDDLEKISHNGIYALAALRQPNLETAISQADLTLRLLPRRPSLWSVVIPARAVAEVYFTLWEQGETAQAKNALQICRILQRYARFLPIAEPTAQLYQGLYEWHTGRVDQAVTHWRKSLLAAQKLKMPYDVGLAYYQMGRHLFNQDYLRRACEIFTLLEVADDLKRAEAVT